MSVFVVGVEGQDAVQTGNGIVRAVLPCQEQSPVAAGDYVVREILQGCVDRPVGIVVFFQGQQCFEFAFEGLRGGLGMLLGKVEISEGLFVFPRAEQFLSPAQVFPFRSRRSVTAVEVFKYAHGGK